MARPILDHFLQRASEVADVADVIESGDPDGRRLFTLQPLRFGAVPVTVLTYQEHDVDLIEWCVPFSEAHEVYGSVWASLKDVDDFLDAAIEGRIWVLCGPSRGHLVEVSRDGVEMRRVIHEGLRGLIPRPGWEARAEKIEYLPYRSSVVGDDDRTDR